MDPFAPIQDISLERYAELSAAMKDTGGDPDKCALVAQRYGVSREAWAAAQQGWTQRMTDPSLMGKVAMAYMPIYQAALGRPAPVAGATYREYVSMMAAIDLSDQATMFTKCGITLPEWTLVATFWSREVADNADYASYSKDLTAEKKRQQKGSAALRWGEDAKAVRPDPTQLKQRAKGPAAAGAAPSAAAAPSGGGNFIAGDQVTVLWSDKRKYIAQVLDLRDSRILVQFPNGEDHWVLGTTVERR